MSGFRSHFRRLVTNYGRVHTVLFSLLVVSILAVSVAFFASSVGRPWMGAMLAAGPDGWSVDSIDVNGLAAQAGVRVGDRPTEINGMAAEAFLSKYEKYGIVFGQLIKELTVVDAQGRMRSASLQDGGLFRGSVIERISLLAVSFFFWLTSLYVFLKKPKSKTARLFCLCALCVGLALSANFAGTRGEALAIYVEIAATLFGPWLLVHFFLVLPEEHASSSRSKSAYLIYVLPAVTFGLFPFLGYADGQALQSFKNIRFVVYGAGFAAAVAVAAFNYLRASSPRTRQQMKIVLLSCLAAVVPVLTLNIIPQIIWRQPLIAPGFSFLFVAFIPLGMGYAVVTQRLMDIDVVIRRGMIYGLISLVMAAILSVGVLAVGVLKPDMTTPEQIVMAIGLGVVAAVLFGPAKRAIESSVDKLFYKDRYDYRQTIQTLSMALNNTRESAEICRLVLAAAANNLNLSGACIFVAGQSGHLELGAAQGTYTDGDVRTKILARLTPRSHSSAVEFPNAVPDNDTDLAFIIPLSSGSREQGVLCLSHKISRQRFSSNDFFLLQGIASVATIALRSAELIREVSMRDTFVSIASHELNTPLTTILGYSELLLKKDPSDPNVKRWAGNIYDSGKRISAMVEDLLNVTRIQSGRIGLKLEAIGVEEVVEEKLSMARETTNKHELVLDACDSAPQVVVDRDKFGQVIWNLVNNAIKYSPKGGRIVVSVRDERERGRVIVSVSDQGMGIANKDKDSLFTTFHRIKRPETASIRGSGLGLYIVKEWTDAMGGEVWLESEVNKGSTFFVAVPTSRGQAGERALP